MHVTKIVFYSIRLRVLEIRISVSFAKIVHQNVSRRNIQDCFFEFIIAFSEKLT